MMVLFNWFHPSEVESSFKGGKVAEMFKVRSVEKVRLCEDEFVELRQGDAECLSVEK